MDILLLENNHDKRAQNWAVYLSIKYLGAYLKHKSKLINKINIGNFFFFYLFKVFENEISVVNWKHFFQAFS